MTIVEIIKKYGTQLNCLKLLEETRWNNGIFCPYCESKKISKKAEKIRNSRFQCQECKNPFSVTVGTIFHGAKKLPEWFTILTLMLNAKKSLSSCQISRDIGMRQASVWEIQNKIRKAMATKESGLLKGIVEMDETYIGGKPRGNTGKNKRGRGTEKTPVVGIISREGQVRTKVVDKGESMNFKTLKTMFDKNVDKIKSVLVTDEYRGYSPMANTGVCHAVINHSQAFVDGEIHTNTIEGFWSLLKRAWYGSHHHYNRDNTHLYVAETSYKYNNRDNTNIFADTLKRMVNLQGD